MNKTETSNQPAPDALWDYALGLYRDRAVETACLRLQDEAGLDAIMLFYCLWAARERGPLGREAMARALAAIAPWTTGVIAPLRAVRRRLKTPASAEFSGQPALRRAVADCELAAERMACFMLAACLPPPRGSPAERAPLEYGDAAASNLADYLAAARISLSPALADDLARLIGAAA